MRYRFDVLLYLPEYFNFFSKVLIWFAIMTMMASSFQVAHGQNRKIDSLNKVIESKEGVEKFETLINKVRVLVNEDNEKALDVAERAYQLACQYKDSARIVLAARVQGQLLNRMDRRSEAIEILNKALPVAERHNFRNDLKLILINLANSYTFAAEYDKSLQLHFRALVINEEDGDLENTGFTLNNIGIVYYKMKNFNEAKTYFERALDIQMKSADRYEIGALFCNLGNCYNSLNQYERALESFKSALDECVKDCSPIALMDANVGMGISYFNLNEAAKAKNHFETALLHAEAKDNKRFIADSHYWLGRIHVTLKDLDVAIGHFIKGEVAAADQSYNESLIRIYDQLANAYDLKGDHHNFSRYIKKYVALKDDIYNEEVMQSLAKSRADYEQRINLATIRANEMTIAQQKRLYTATLIIAVMSVFIVIGLVVAYRMLKRTNTKLSKAQDVIFEQNRELSKRNRELDRMVEKKTEELKLVNLSLKQMNDELDTFILKSAEDIRAPLASLLGICHVALLDIKDEASLVYMQKISKTTELLNSILKRLLALNKINNSKPTLAETDLQALVDHVISIQQKKGLPENLIVRKNIVQNASLFTDRELMSIVLENTIDNALKFCNGAVEKEHFIEINVAPSGNGRVSVKVVDNREDVHESDSSDLFQIFHGSEFEMGENGEGKQDLYFVKTAAKKIGGKVGVKKTPEGYNELTLVF